MSYERDKNGHNRGVGSIAAYDQNPARRQRMEQGVALTKRRDRAMVRTLQGFGAVNTGGMRGEGTGAMGTGPSQRDNSTGRASTTAGVTPGGGSGTMVKSTHPTKFTPITVADYAVSTTSAPVSGPILGGGGYNTSPVGGGSTTNANPCSPGTVWDGTKCVPFGLPNPNTGDTTGTTSGPTGGAGSQYGEGTGIVPPPLTTPPADNNPLPDPTQIPTDTGMDTTTMLLIGGAAVAAWYLFLRKPAGGGA